ncbi:hypothetical protein ACJQWK_11779 [Exserohilum turcicum]
MSNQDYYGQSQGHAQGYGAYNQGYPPQNQAYGQQEHNQYGQNSPTRKDRALTLHLRMTHTHKHLMMHTVLLHKPIISKATTKTGSIPTCRLGISNLPTMTPTNNTEHSHKAMVIKRTVNLAPKEIAGLVQLS